MSKYIDLDAERKRQFLINLRVQSLLIKFIAEDQEIDLKEVVGMFFERAVEDVDEFSQAEMNEQLRLMDRALEEAIAKQESTVCEITVSRVNDRN